MKIEKNNRYFNIACYVFFTGLALLIASFVLFHIRQVLSVISQVIKTTYILLEPLIIGLIIAYLLDPIVDFYENRCRALSFSDLFLKHSKKKNKVKKRWPMRTVPTLFAFLTLLMIIGVFILLIIMNIRQVAGSFSILKVKESLTGYLSYFEEMIGNFSGIAQAFGLSKGQEDFLQEFYATINQGFLNFYNQFISSLSIWGLHLMNIVLAFVIAFYLLQDNKRLWTVSRQFAQKLLGKQYSTLSLLLRKIDCAFAGYIRGEILDSIIITILTSGALTIIQLDFAIIIGIISGIFNLIPYFGPIVGFILAVGIGLLDPNPLKALYGAIAILIIQQIDGWFIVPKIVGDCVKIHPVIVLLVILIGGNLFGLIGMLLAVPFTAIIRILLIYFFPDYFEE